MTINNTEIFMIEALGGKSKAETIASFCKTFDTFDFDKIKVVKEKKTREMTLNFILKNRNPKKDIFIFVDDIIFLKGWHNGFDRVTKDGVIVGFSMLNQDGETIQDFGYDLISLDNHLSSKALYKGELRSKKKLPYQRECSAVCGCAMWISKKVLDKINKFPLDGKNRWGEMIYSSLARNEGFKTIVLSAHLIHHGTSTKSNKNHLLSSNSWLIEKDMWSKLSRKYFVNSPVSKKLYSKFSNEFLKLINDTVKLLVFGCGTISDFVSKNYLNNQDVNYSSTLIEEFGKKFHNKTIKNFNDLDFNEYDKIFISSIGYEKKVLKIIPNKHRHKTICLERSIKSKYIYYTVLNYKFFL